MVALRSLLIALIGLGFWGLGGCGTQSETPMNSVPPATAELSADQILEAFSVVSYDFTTVSRPELARRAEVVATGTVVQVVAGRIDGAESMDEPFAARNSAVEVAVTRPVKGVEASSRLWLELPVAPERLAPALPAGTALALFLASARLDSKNLPMGSAGSEIPENATLWSPVHPQGLMVEYGNGEGVVEPMAHEVYRGRLVEDVVRDIRPS